MYFMAKNQFSSANSKPIFPNKPAKRYRKFVCMHCGGKNIKPVLCYSETGKKQGTRYHCQDCDKTDFKKEIL